MLQSIIVGVIVVFAVLYCAWIFLPAGWRRHGAARLAAHASRSGLDASTARELQARLERTAACGECASCKGCAPAARNEAPQR
jgi:hypothetical protein